VLNSAENSSALCRHVFEVFEVKQNEPIMAGLKGSTTKQHFPLVSVAAQQCKL